MAVYAMVPARKGSERLKLKNLLNINGRPVVSYGIDIAKQAQSFDRIILNSDIPELEAVAINEGVDFYLRDNQIANSDTSSDEVVYDFFNQFEEADIVVWINAISPLQDPDEIKRALAYFESEGLDSLISSCLFSRHALFQGKPINFDKKSKFAKTQNLEPIEIFSYSFMIWRRSAFITAFENSGSAMFCGKFSTFLVDFKSMLAIKEQEDFDLIRKLM